MKNNHLSRRMFIGSSAVAAAGALILPKISFARTVLSGADKPNSVVGGVLIGVTTYSYGQMKNVTAEDMLQYCLQDNISGVELRGDAAELTAGAPKRATGQMGADFSKAMADWRANISMDKFKAIRKMYNDAGVTIYAYKPVVFGVNNTDEEIEYAFNAAKALGATHCNCEMPDSDAQTKRIGDLATKHKMRVGYHAHTNATPTLWDTAMSQSEYNCINLDIGHYVAGTSSSPIPFIEKNHARITSMHIKDRKFNNGPNTPWGEGDTPIKDVLLLMKKNHYKFPATIELEYKIPAGSDDVKEVLKCRDFAAAILKG
ncbi:TIM barrel protein [Mucilaginibacter sp.]|uniref:sugar phosphate isomerase/epimerase family protein n=1 Tax=Mucilaginibacter sp. TaxID=1882438 RepID=UPI0026234388|nr:TIM barrel protein [Mucilaginibacter sp.]MDB4924066.1 sugar phosphate isomerase/epimerase [Mucilaginibacter sp.]